MLLWKHFHFARVSWPRITEEYFVISEWIEIYDLAFNCIVVRQCDVPFGRIHSKISSQHCKDIIPLSLASIATGNFTVSLSFICRWFVSFSQAFKIYTNLYSKGLFWRYNWHVIKCTDLKCWVRFDSSLYTYAAATSR